MGAKSVVITGILGDNTLTNLVFENGKSTEITIQKSRKAFSGTGDIFASIVTGLLCKGKTLVNAVDIASKYIFDVIELTISENTPVIHGVQFEPLLFKLGGNYYEE